MNTIEEKVHTIIQEEIAERVIYQDRHAEETLRRCLQSLESRMQIYARSLHTQGKLDALGELEELVKSANVTANDKSNHEDVRRAKLADEILMPETKRIILSHIASLKEPLINI